MSPQTSFFDLSNIYLSGLNLKFGTILRRDDEAEAQQGTAIQLKVSLQIMLFFFTDERCPMLFIVAEEFKKHHNILYIYQLLEILLLLKMK